MRALNIFVIILSVLGLSAFSLVFVYSSTMGDSDSLQVSSLGLTAFQKQLVFYGGGLGMFYALSRFPYRHWMGVALFLYVANLLLLVYVWQFGVIRGGARSWIDLKVTLFQPSETMKTAWLLYLCSWLRYRKKLRHFQGLFMPFLITFIPMFLVLLQPDMGTAGLYIPTLFILLYLCGARRKHLLLIISFMILSLIPLWFFGLKGYQKARVMALVHPEEHALGTGYQMNHSLLAIGEGHWLGKGVGEGRVNRLNLLPESHTDFIFSIIAEELGFVGASMLILLYLSLFLSCIWLGGRTREPYGRFLAFGIGSLLAAQTFINLGVAMGLLPTTGITLPFVSSGGSSFISCCIMAGIVLSIARHHVPVLSKDDFKEM
jgi:rod shape-determining protein RodA